MYVTIIAGIFFIADFFGHKYSGFPLPLKAQLLYILMMAFMLLIYSPTLLMGYGAIDHGKIFLYYTFVSYAVGNFLLFFLPRNRFIFIAENSWLIFICAFISSSLVIFLFGNDLLEGYTGWENMGVNRSTIKQPLAVLFVLSLSWFIFERKLWIFLLSCVGLLLSLYGVYISSSQSLLVSVAGILFLAFLMSFKNKIYLIKSLILAISMGIFAIPYLIYSKSWERLTSLIFLKDEYLLGGGYDTSRIDLIQEGLSLFRESPIFGGNIYNTQGLYCHCFPIDVLMAGGVIGAILMVIILYGCLRGAWRIYKNCDGKYYWIILLSLFLFSQGLFHGDYCTLISMQTAILLSADMIFSKDNIR